MRIKTKPFLILLISLAAGLAGRILLAQDTPGKPQAAAETDARDAEYANEIRPLLGEYCTKCHGPDEMKSGIRVDLLNGQFQDQHLALWEDMADQLEDEEMPPAKKRQPTEEQRERLVTWIRDGIKAAQLKSGERNGWARRLTVPQYRNTLNDLLGLEDNLAKLLPGDGTSKDGFTNDGSTLQMSPLQMDYYLEIAGRALDLSLVDPAQKPKIQNFRMDLGQDINANPLKTKLELGAGSHLLQNADFKVTELSPSKPFAYDPQPMKREYDFIEGYAGNNTVRGQRHFSGLEHAVFACMRGTEGYPRGEAYSPAPGALLLRPAIPSTELFGQGSTLGPMANFKISLRELPADGQFRIKVTASRFERDGLLLDPAMRPPLSSNGIKAAFADDRAAAMVPEAGIYQVNLAHAVQGNGDRLELLLDGLPYHFVIKGGSGGGINDDVIEVNDPGDFKFDSMVVTVPGKDRMINLHEMHLISGNRNVAQDAVITSSSVFSADGRFDFTNLIDGNFDNLAHTAEQDDPWFRLDFKTPQKVESIHVWNRNGYESRFQGAVAVFSLNGKEVHRQPLISTAGMRRDALMLVPLDKGELRVEARHGKNISPIALTFQRVPAGSEQERAYTAFAARTPQLGVHLGFRRDCGSTLPLIAPPLPVNSNTPAEYLFTGAINNFPSPSLSENNPNYLAGIREIGVRSEFTDGRDMPRLCLHSVEFEGPYYSAWPPATHSNIFIESPNRNDPPKYAREILESFMSRAYRRTPTPTEVSLVHNVWSDSFRKNKDMRASVKDALEVVLTSPQFLYLIESSATPAAEDLTPHELASKLSFFLWNTMPDANLRQAADAGTLHAALAAETDRLLDDPRARRFFDEFTSQWLALDKFDIVEVDRKLFPKMDRDTREQLRREPAAFLRHLVAGNLPARNLIDSDFIMANDAVASYYGLGDRCESGMEFTPIPHGSKDRGGLLTQAGILCGLSSGRESNPVKRGAWMARKIVAEPPGDPPPNVPELKEGEDKHLTLRQRLEQHRNQQGCVKCHEKIDPWGIPMEEFDVAGMRKKTPKLDAGSTLPDGTKVAGFNDLRAYLADDRMDQVAYSFMKHLATYALGRTLSHWEQATLKKDCLTLRPGGYKTRDMIHWLVRSDLFIKK